MATLQELQDKVVELQASVDAEQQQVADLLAQNQVTVDALNEQITALTAQLDAAADPAEIQAVIDGLEAVKADIETTA